MRQIGLVFSLLGKVTTSPEALEDFKDALGRLVTDAAMCSKLAKETREAFNKWGLMCSELHSCSEAEITSTSVKREAAKIDEEMSELEKQFSTEAKDTAAAQVKAAAKQVENAERRLDTALEKIPSGWQATVQGLVTTLGQVAPYLIAARLPGTLAGSNPMAPGQTAGPNATSGSAPNLNDPAYAVAVTIRGQVSHFYDYLGGDSGTVDWTKFAKSSEDLSAPSGIVYLLGNFNGQKTNLDVTNTEPNKKVVALLNTLIKVS